MSKQSFFFYILLLKLMNYSYMHDIMHPVCNVLTVKYMLNNEVRLTTGVYGMFLPPLLHVWWLRWAADHMLH